MSVSIKTLFIKAGASKADDIRRVTIPAEAKGTAFDHLCTQLRATYGLDKATPLVAKYKDEEDEWITVSSNVELADAIAAATAARPLRLFVAPAASDVNFAALSVPATPAVGASTASLASLAPAPAATAAAAVPPALSLPASTPNSKVVVETKPEPVAAPSAAAPAAAEPKPAAAVHSVSSLGAKAEDEDGFVHVANADAAKPASPPAAAAPAAALKADTPKEAPKAEPKKEEPKAAAPKEEVVALKKEEAKAAPVPAAEPVKEAPKETTPAPAPVVTVTPVIAKPEETKPAPAPAPAPAAAPAVSNVTVIPLTLSDSLIDLPKTSPAPAVVAKHPAAAPVVAAPAPAPTVAAPKAEVKPAPAAAPAAAKPTTAAPAAGEVVHTGVVCDGCGADPIRGIRYNCITCSNFDLCSKCESDSKKHPVTHAMLKIRKPIDYTALAAKQPAAKGAATASAATATAPATVPKPAKPEFKAEYVSDVSVPDGSKVTPGAALHKLWRVKNVGVAQWPAGTTLVHVGGEIAPAATQPADLVAVPLAKPGECVDVGLYLAMPHAAGRHTGYYRLQLPAAVTTTGAAQQFGSRMWIDVLVVPAAEMPNAPAPDAAVVAAVAPKPDLKKEAAPAPAPAKTPEPAAKPEAPKAAPAPAKPSAPAPVAKTGYKYQRELEELLSMGFSDQELVMYLLSNNSGDVGRVVNWMLQNAH